MVDLDVLCTEQYGRGLYTRRKVSCGTEILSEDPFLHVLSRSQQSTRCDWCLVESHSLSRCARCKSTWYCGTLCQRNDWFQHKAECKGIAAIQPHAPTDTMRLVVRALQKKKQGTPWGMESLCSVKGSLGTMEKEMVTEQLHGVNALLRDEFDGHLAYDVLCKLLCNTFSICDDEMRPIGAGIYVQCSLLNHSCDPNCVVLFAGTKLTLRTVKDIPGGDQLLISYVDLVDSCNHRRAQLKKVYSFTCVCERCLQEGGEGEETAENSKELNYRESLKVMQDWESILRCHQLSPRCTLVTAIKEAELMYDAQIGLGMWKYAAETASRLVDLYRKCLFPFHPLIGLTLMKLGKLQRFEGAPHHLKASVSSLTQAVHCLGISYGPAHPLTQQAQEMLMDSNAELQSRNCDDT